MAQKPQKVMDVQRPERVAPTATARPLIVTNRPILSNDPMMVPDGASPAEANKTAEPMARTARTIKPIDVASAEPAESVEPVAALTAAEPVPAEAAKADAVTDQPTETESKVAEMIDTTPQPVDPAAAAEPGAASDGVAKPISAPDLSVPEEDMPKRDAEAEVAADEAAALEAQTAREQELEQLVASGKYAVPINAVQRKRSRTVTTLLCLLTLVLAAALFDAALDAGIVKLSLNIPHTNFFSGS